MTAWLDHFLFGLYPYICLAVFFIGSWIRFDRDQYTWKSDSSQFAPGQLALGQQPVSHRRAVLFFGHFVGMPHLHFMYEAFISAGDKAADGHRQRRHCRPAGLYRREPCCTGASDRRTHPRYQQNQRHPAAVAAVVQLALGLATLPLSAQHLDGSVMMQLVAGRKPSLPKLLGLVARRELVFKLHMALGMTVF